MFQWPPLDASTGAVGPQMNTFEQVTSNDHQMSVAGRVGGGAEGEIRSHVRYLGGGAGLMSDIGVGAVPIFQCIMGNGHMGTS